MKMPHMGARTVERSVSRIQAVRKISAITVAVVAVALLAGGGAAYAIGSAANVGHNQEVQQVTVTTPSPAVTNDTPLPTPEGGIVNPNAVDNGTPPTPEGGIVNPNAVDNGTLPVQQH